MTLLLDTHVLIWWLSGSRKLGRRARRSVENGQAVWVSAASAWEMAIKAALGRLVFGESIEKSLPRELDRCGFQSLSVSVAHALAAGTLPRHHDDPFDRMLVAQAEAEGLTLVTADDIFTLYGVAVLDARD